MEKHDLFLRVYFIVSIKKNRNTEVILLQNEI